MEAFEPLQLVREKLERNVALNPAARIAIYPYALGNSDGLAAFTPPDNENLGTGRLAEGGSVAVSVKRGDDVNAAPPAIIKIDVEGHEGAVLRGLAKTIASHRPIILCEFSAATKSGDDDLRVFLPDAYRCLILAGVEIPYLTAYSGAGRGEILLMFPDEKASVVYAACHQVSPAAAA